MGRWTLLDTSALTLPNCMTWQGLYSFVAILGMEMHSKICCRPLVVQCMVPKQSVIGPRPCECHI